MQARLHNPWELESKTKSSIIFYVNLGVHLKSLIIRVGRTGISILLTYGQCFFSLSLITTTS